MHSLGPPANACSGRSDGAFANPADQAEYFYCASGRASQCQGCPTSQLFQAECGQCLPIGTSKYNSCIIKFSLVKLQNN